MKLLITAVVVGASIRYLGWDANVMWALFGLCAVCKVVIVASDLANKK